jgi:hypothetical protein
MKAIAYRNDVPQNYRIFVSEDRIIDWPTILHPY